ncbi:hypothetical protein ACOW85_001671 [Vibrio parahaemolyticus]
MNPQLLALLQLLSGGNQNQFNSNQQNPLLALLGGGGQQQDLTQMLIAALSGVTGQQQNAINPQVLQALLGGGQSQPQQNDIGSLLLQALAGGQQQSQGSLDASKLLELLQAPNGKTKEKTAEELLAELLKGGKQEGGEEDDILTRLQNAAKQSSQQKESEADLTEAIQFVLEYDKFVEENDDLFPDWFNAKEVKDDIDKWAKTPVERAQGLAAATVRAFFKDENMLDLLEERDRTTVQDKILKDGIKPHEIDRKLAWPLVERARFNKSKLGESGREISGAKESEAMKEYGSIFEMGQRANNAESA